MRQHTGLFKPKMLALTVASALGSYSLPGIAQETSEAGPDVEIIEVSGIRGSLVRSMDVKRSSEGVVDAISAEDIGKFPDTNLAESLQRITGVSIDRQNNEGSRVTVRGWGPEFNLITLNGRQMPAANLSATSVNNQRSFDFANLAAESVTGVEVYKTGKAHVNTGGIGATINILTYKPLSNPGFQANVGAKAIMDDTRVGNDITPEISGIISNTFADDTIGISVVASRSERDNFQGSGQVTSGWNSNYTDDSQTDIVAAPQNYMYVFEDFSRTRTNAQVTLQYQPADNFTATLDYTYSEFDQDVGRQELSAWFGSGNGAGTEFSPVDANGVSSPLVLRNSDCCDIGMGVGSWGTTNENDSVGLNLEWQVNDNLNLTFDAHSSSAEAKPKDYRGSNNIVTAAIWKRIDTEVDFTQNVPTMNIIATPGLPFDENAVGGHRLDPADVIVSGTSHRNGYMKTDIDQYQLQGEYVFDSGIVSSIDFGVSHQVMKNRTAFSLNQGGDWGNGVGWTGQTTGGDWNTPDGDGDNNFRDEAFTVQDLVDVPGDDIGVEGQHIYVDYDMFTQDVAALYANNPTLPGNVFANCPTGTLCVDPNYSTDLRLEEEQLAFYVQANLVFDIGDKPAMLNVGLRHESTDVTSESLIPNYVGELWLSPNELLLQADGGVFADGTGDYSELLPSVDFQIDLTDDIVARASYSKTMARANYSQLQAGAAPGGSQARTFDNSTGASGNPGLKPYLSDNIDLSIEYYYAEGSYASIGYYTKDVKNFIGSTIYDQVIYPDLVNPVSGDRLAEAQAAVVNQDNAANEIRQYYVDRGWVDANGNLTGDLGVYDPLSFRITAPVNDSATATIDGFEIAVQHLFGESGFGVIANYTTVDGDVSYDKSLLFEDQFALPGLSDSANLVAFYDKDGFQVRLAYNWRDEFLSSEFGGGGNGQFEPGYTEAYAQLDVNISYEVTDNFTVAFEGINLLEEDRRVHARGDDMIVYAAEQSARYALSARYKF